MNWQVTSPWASLNNDFPCLDHLKIINSLADLKIKKDCIFFFSLSLFVAVVAQSYETQVYDAYVIRGNTALFKCHVPAFVSDQVDVFSWELDDGSVRWSSLSNPSLFG